MIDDWRVTWYHVEETLGSTWALCVLCRLSEGDARFNELRRDGGGTTAKTLSARLSELACAGLVERTVPRDEAGRDDSGRDDCGVLTVDSAATRAACEEGC